MVFSNSIPSKMLIRLLVSLAAACVPVLATAALCSQPPITAAEATHPLRCNLIQLENRGQSTSESTERPYAALMKQQGVQRAFFEVRSVWRHGKAKDTHIVRRLYFRSYEGPDAQIIDQQPLDAIRQSGLESLLDQTALNRMNNAELFGGVEGVRHPEGKPMYTYLEFFEDPSRIERPTFASPSGKSDPFFVAVALGDAIEVGNLLHRQKFSREQLNGALFVAVRNYYDNTGVIKLLIEAGGDFNARTKDGQTLLMAAIGIPAQVRALLKMGANVNDRDRFGNTALKLAEQSRDSQSAEVLRQAGGTK